MAYNDIKFKDENGRPYGIKQANNQPMVINSSKVMEIVQGNITGASFIHKFGRTPDFDTTDNFATVWDGAEDGEVWEKMVYTYSTTADIDSLVSSDNSDTQDVEVRIKEKVVIIEQVVEEHIKEKQAVSLSASAYVKRKKRRKSSSVSNKDRPREKKRHRTQSIVPNRSNVD